MGGGGGGGGGGGEAYNGTPNKGSSEKWSNGWFHWLELCISFLEHPVVI